MKTEVERILDQLTRAYEAGAWHGPSVRELIDPVSAEAAAVHPLDGRHSIWELVLHIAAWEDIARRRIKGERLDTDTLLARQNFPPVEDHSPEAWESAKRHLHATHHRLRATVARLTDADLARPIEGTTYTVYFLLHGVIQHDLYHAGQIALLRQP